MLNSFSSDIDSHAIALRVEKRNVFSRTSSLIPFRIKQKMLQTCVLVGYDWGIYSSEAT